MRGKLYLCATPIGNLDDVSKRLEKTLGEADIIAAEDTRHTRKLLNHLNISKPMISYFEHNRRQRGEVILEELKRGKNVALVSDAGTPAISDPGEDLVFLCAREGIEVVPIPGAVAAICALIVSALPTGRFFFEGFLPVNKKGREERLSEIKSLKQTIIFYEAPHKLLTTLKDMLKILGDRKITLCREMTKRYEETMRTTLSEAVRHYTENSPKGEFVLVLEGSTTPETAVLEDIDMEERFKTLVENGTDEKEAMKEIAKLLGISKREVYAKIKTKKE